jgi:hypothetical protein
MGRHLVHRSDGNADAIRRGLEQVGALVYPLGQPVDFLVLFKKRLWALEVKAGRGQVRDGQQRDFLLVWADVARVVRTLEEALTVIGARVQK